MIIFQLKKRTNKEDDRQTNNSKEQDLKDLKFFVLDIFEI